ncbi:rhodanese-like domain-containing protein, partial [Gammaproteobacteria bacterium]|nr:rhodanese-like domain-containing protein [Gammaproteobacteria bacterium]
MNSSASTESDARSILASGCRLIDVRAPGEFLAGHIPGAINAPILDDTERASVGTCYQREGPDAAIALGHRLVSGENKIARIAAWHALASEPDARLLCWRGGLRSATARQWLAEAGLERPLVQGGYKALRRAAMAVLEEAAAWPMLIVGGCTGVRKTAL